MSLPEGRVHGREWARQRAERHALVASRRHPSLL
jgi:hypothetical protein